MYRSKKSGKIGMFITIAILILLVILTNIETSKFSKGENIFNKIVMPIQNGLVHLKNKFAGNESFFSNVEQLQEENDKLKKKNSELEEQLRELEIIKAENTTLREYVNMADKYSDYKTVPGYIIDKDISNLSDTLVINVGSKDGVKANMPVISSEGLVGYVISSTNYTSKVKPIIDISSSVSATLETSRDNVMVKGILDSNSNLKVTYVSPDTELVLGDIIETSGIGGIYPKGILIGKIKEIKESSNIIDRYAIIETAVNFTKLETVLVITE